MIVGQRAASAIVLLAGVLFTASCATSNGASEPVSDGGMQVPSVVASASQSDTSGTDQASGGSQAPNIGPCPSELESIIDAQSVGVVTPLTSLDGTPGALLSAFPSAPVCAIDVAETDRVGRYAFWQDGKIDGMAAALNAAGYVGDLDPGDHGDRFGIFKVGSTQIFLTDQFGAGGTPLPTGSYVLAYRSG